MLFTGPRGVGKTTCARILAKMINSKENGSSDEDYSFNNSIWFKYKVNQPISKDEIILINNQKSIEFIKNKKVRLTYKGKDYGFYRIIKEVENCYYLKK